MSKKVVQEEPIIAEDFMIGNTHVRIATNYCCKPEEVQPILDRIAQTALEHIRAAAYAEQSKT